MSVSLHSSPPQRPIQIEFPTSGGEVGLVNAYSIDRSMHDQYVVSVFGMVSGGRLLRQWSFALERRSLELKRLELNDYLSRIRGQASGGRFVNMFETIAAAAIEPIPVDNFSLTVQDQLAEFTFGGWSWNAASIAANPVFPERKVTGTVFAVLRCSTALQLAWLQSIYGN